MAKIIAIVSGKGGTGKSTISAAIGYSYAKKGASVLICDLDIGLRSLDILLGLQDRVVYDLGDVLEKRIKWPDACAKHKAYSGFHLLSTPVSVTKNFDVFKTIEIIKKASKEYDYVILDLPAGLGLSVIMAKEICDEVCIVSTPDAVTIRDSRKICDEIAFSCSVSTRLIINHVSKSSIITSGIKNLDEIIDAVGVPLIAVIKEDEWIKSYFALEPVKPCLKETTLVFDAIIKRLENEYVPLIVKTV
ncbi:MAG: P-loop NTPase [Oscillospiraceae bacterium]